MSIFPETTLVKVTFRRRNQHTNSKILQKCSCIIHISVGQAYHEGEKFLATMDLINQTFSSCLVMVCDTLQRHTLKFKYPKKTDLQLYTEALTQGTQWIERNRVALQYLKIPVKVYRWDYWLQHPDYLRYRKEVDRLYRSKNDYMSSIHHTIEKFLDRQKSAGLLSISYQNAFEICKTYILEECPILIPLWAQTGCEFVIYPRFRTPAMTSSYNYFIRDHHKHLLQEVALKFNHRVKPKKLSFVLPKNTQEPEEATI